LPPEQLVNIIEQQQAIVQQQAMIGQLQARTAQGESDQQPDSSKAVYLTTDEIRKAQGTHKSPLKKVAQA